MSKSTTQWESESECKCLTCNKKPTGSQFSMMTTARTKTKRLMEKTKKNAIEQFGVRKATRTVIHWEH